MVIKLQDFNLNDLHKIDLTELSKLIPDAQAKHYFLEIIGQEHYKLLAYISTLYENETILDIGTYKGCSALALSYNKNNKVISFDLTDDPLCVKYTENISYIVDDVTSKTYKDTIINSPFIMLDTNHDGSFENYFHKYLESINWKGTLLLDDILLNNQMKDYWNSIKQEKINITSLGHWSGTGLVYFE